MYSIYAGDIRIYTDTFALPDMRALSPTLTLEDNTAGKLSLVLPPENRGYKTVERLTTDIRVERNGEEIWAGRVLEETKDFYNCRVLTCEGELAFFNDTIQPQREYGGSTIRAYLEALIEIHNAHVPENRRFQIGAVTVVDEDFPTYYTNYETTMELMEALVERYGGHMRVRKQDGVRYLDYLKEYPDTATQVIQFGSNLIDFTRNWDSSEYASVVIPLGNTLKKSPIKALDAYLTVESVNEGSMYVACPEAVESFGWIARVVHWDDISDPDVLLKKGQEYLNELQFDTLELEVSALDLSYMNVDHESIKLLDEVRVISRPHGLDRMFPVTKLSIPLDNPENTKFTMGSSIKTSLTAANHQENAEILNKIDILPKAHALLDEAKDNATQIMTMATTGFITITKDDYGSDTLYISNVRDYTKADKLWKWNMNGLGYSNDGGKTFGLAITMNGAIVADYITTGVLNADVIRAGILRDPGFNTVFNLYTGTLTMRKGSIYIGKGADGSDTFSVDEEGNLYARRGTFAGALLAASGTFNGKLVGVEGDFKGIVQASDFLDRAGNSMMNNGKFKGEYLDLMGIHVVNKNGVTVMTIDQGGIRFGRGFSPIKYQFAESFYGPWHNEMSSDDLYRRESVDGGETWETPYKFVGTDGSDANVPKYITETKITETTIESPKIVGGEIHGAQFYDHGGGFTFWSENGKTCFGSITYESNGIYIGGIDGITLDPGMGGVRIGNGRNTSAVLTVNNFPLFVSSGDIEINATFA